MDTRTVEIELCRGRLCKAWKNKYYQEILQSSNIFLSRTLKFDMDRLHLYSWIWFELKLETWHLKLETETWNLKLKLETWNWNLELIFDLKFGIEFEIETWNWSLKLKLEIETWYWNLNMKLEIETWNSNLKLKLDIETWHWNSNLKLEIETWNQNLKLKLEIETLNWNFALLCAFLVPPPFFLALWGNFWGRGQVQKHLWNLLM